MWIVIGVAAIILIATAIIGNKVGQNHLVANRSYETIEEKTKRDHEGSSTVIAIAETRNEAEEIAELYGIELIEYSYKTAVYITQKEAEELVRWGKEQGYPAIAINQKYSVN